ncbi:hypothetical protein P691DRAFT_764467 [Macrolepiota fuliginosa MF-IS2]|uniref:F-box domain-containing protein n=1 Tax=Macrolepiota fuliginosa MF-IS2 TaxID=1400762 RepID=A0A9P6BXM4_9AGAR|nr:hypothetical protein P691DRAFT_764467 [Macrolepiota fuliginosa MF-IS2]
MGALTGCPQCGYPDNTLKTTEFAQPWLSLPSALSPVESVSPHPANDESTLLHQEISRIDSAVRQLYEERAARCRRLNEIQSLPANLPFNILSTIFEFVCPPSEYNTSHQRVRRNNAKPLVLPVFALCAVSSRWRKVVLSMPQLWAKLDWDWRYHLSQDDTSALLHTYFARASPRLFDLKLTVDEKWEVENTIPYVPDHVDGHFKALKHSIFLENAHKIGILKLDAPNRWLHLVSRPFTHLSDLSLSSGRIDSRMDLSSLPSLAHLRLTNTKVTPILPWKQILTIHLVKSHANVSLELLARCPNLIHFHSQHPNHVRNESIIQKLRFPITLSHLVWLEWTCISSVWDDALFRHTHLPSLQRLSLTGDVSWSHDWEDVLKTFLSRLPPSSIDLELGYVRHFTDGPVPALKTLFRALPELHSLTLLEDDHSFVEKVLNLLIPFPLAYSPSSPSFSPSSSPLSSPLSSPPVSPVSNLYYDVIYLPTLHILSLRCPDRENAKAKDGGGVFTRLRGAPQQLPTIAEGDIFVELIRQRRRMLHLTAFHLDLDFSPAWRMKSQEELIALVEEGLELELLEKSKRVEWLPFCLV